MAEKQVSTSNSLNSSDTEETCQQYALKMEAKTLAFETDKLSPRAGGDGATTDVSTAEPHGECAATATGLSEGLEMLLQKQRRDLMLELTKLQTGHRPVTSTESRETLEDFFSGGDRERQTNSRPQSVISEVQGLSERQPVSSVLRSHAFRRNLEDVIRGTLVRQDRELQQTLRLRSAGFNVGASRPVPANPSADTFQQHLESLSQLSHSSRTSSGSHPSLGLADVFSPPPAPLPPMPQQGQPMHYQQQQQQQQQQQPQQFPSMQSFPSSQWRPQQHMPPNPYQQQQSWQQQQQQQQQQYSQWQQQQQQQRQWPQPQPWQQPVQPQQPWLMQNSPQQANGNINMESYMQQANREEAVFEISNLVQRQLVSSTLNSEFRGTLENTMLAHLQNTEADGLSVANFVQSLPQRRHRRNDFSHLGIQAPSRSQPTAASSSGTATWAAPELDTLRRQMEEMQTMMRLTFELQLDMQRSIRQEVAAALSGQHGQVPNTQSAQGAMPPSQPASEGNCVICLEKSVDAVLYQCGHMCCCLACGLRLKQMGSHCPMCRAPIRDVIRAYRCQME